MRATAIKGLASVVDTGESERHRVACVVSVACVWSQRHVVFIRLDLTRQVGVWANPTDPLSCTGVSGRATQPLARSRVLL